MPSILITGANRGLGLEFARQYAADGWRVLATCRDPGKASALKKVKGDIAVHGLDVADFPRIDALAKELKSEAIDLLVNNAGVYGSGSQALNKLDYDEWADVMRINCMAPIRISQAFAPHVAKSEKKTIVAISSKMGSVTDNTSGGYYVYRSSKAALNIAMKSLAIDLAPRQIVTAILHPGWVRTDMGGPNALIGPEESVAGMRKVIAGLTPRKNGKFFGYDGAVVPW